jgi:hypothetical protein
LALSMDVLGISSSLPDWIMSCAFIASCGGDDKDSCDGNQMIGTTRGPTPQVLLAVGTTRNCIHIMRTTAAGRSPMETLLTIASTQQQLLYSMALWVRVRAVPGNSVPSSSSSSSKEPPPLSNPASAPQVIPKDPQRLSANIDIWVASGRAEWSCFRIQYYQSVLIL